MKNTKKLFATVLALIMALALAVPALASNTPATADITIVDAVSGETYNAYKIFDYTASGDNYSYTMPADSAWGTVVDGYAYDADADANTPAVDVFTLTASASDASVLVVSINSAVTLDPADFAAYLAGNMAGKTATQTVTATTANNVVSATFTALPLGYYFVDTSLGSLCSLFNAGTEQVLSEKNEVPSINKEISLDGTNYGTTTVTASIGDTIYYQMTVNIPAAGVDKPITVYDSMEPGLSYVNDSFTHTHVVDVSGTPTAVTVDGAGFTSGAGGGGNWEFTYTIPAGTTGPITLRYRATLDSDAEIAVPVAEGSVATNDNSAWLTYSAQTSVRNTVSVTTYNIPVYKYTVIDDTETPLAGATFQLRRTISIPGEDPQDMPTLIAEYATATLTTAGGADTAAIYTITGWTDLADTTNDGVANPDVPATGFVTPASGNIVIKGVALDTYNLIETDAPAGYNLLTSPVAVEINDDATYMLDGADESTTLIYVLNESGMELPSTGGVGTTIFYVLGSLLAVGAVVLLVTKKRVHDSEV